MHPGFGVGVGDVREVRVFRLHGSHGETRWRARRASVPLRHQQVLSVAPWGLVGQPGQLSPLVIHLSDVMASAATL